MTGILSREKFSSSIMALFFLSCLTSMTAMDVFSTVICLITLVELIRGKSQFVWFHKKVFIALAIGLVTATALSFVFGATTGAPWLMRLQELKWILVLLLMASYMQKMKWSWSTFQVWAGIFLVASISVLILYLNEKDPTVVPGTEARHIYRAGGFFNDAMTQAHLYAVVFGWFLGLFLERVHSTWKQGLVWSVVIVFGFLSVFFTFTRGIWLALAVVIPVIFFLRHRKQFKYFLASTLSLGIVLAVVWPKFLIRLQYSFQKNPSDTTRKSIWASNWEIFKDHPIFGAGYGENTRLLPEYYQKLGIAADTLVSHAHNQYLHLLAGTGLIGFLFYMGFLLYFLTWNWSLWRHFRSQKGTWQKGLCLGVLASQGLFLVGGLTEANFEHAKMRYILILTWAFLFLLEKNRRNQASS